MWSPAHSYFIRTTVLDKTQSSFLPTYNIDSSVEFTESYRVGDGDITEHGVEALFFLLFNNIIDSRWFRDVLAVILLHRKNILRGQHFWNNNFATFGEGLQPRGIFYSYFSCVFSGSVCLVYLASPPKSAVDLIGCRVKEIRFVSFYFLIFLAIPSR